MPLTNEQIATLLALPKRRGGGKRKTGPDTSVRDYQTWFKLAHSFLDEEAGTGELLRCENESCLDPRALAGEGKGIVVTQVNGKWMCRHCFLAGWLLDDPDQAQIEIAV